MRGPAATAAGTRARCGALLVLAAVLLFAVTVVVSLSTAGTAYVWYDNMISDLGDGACRVRGGRWICSPRHVLFNTGVSLTGVLLMAAGACLMRWWGRALAGSVVVMGAGLVATGVFPAGNTAGLHLAAVVLALVVPATGFLVSGIRPGTPWLRRRRATRVVLASVALVFAAVSRLPDGVVPRGAGELVIVGALLLALLVEAGCVLTRGSRAVDVSR
ncbi:DUF998 domain-containing protein [Kocuria tytonis]|uniref:DUF998 domain-containing protein n=1 Tax=Kocuria tytonis TaxID=2054280 RepID=UPI00131406F1|nr:DUF998 domain-containing protein [Kocuria tytonis]